MSVKNPELQLPLNPPTKPPPPRPRSARYGQKAPPPHNPAPQSKAALRSQARVLGGPPADQRGHNGPRYVSEKQEMALGLGAFQAIPYAPLLVGRLVPLGGGNALEARHVFPRDSHSGA